MAWQQADSNQCHGHRLPTSLAAAMDTSAGAGVDSRDHDVDMHDDVGAGGGAPHGADEPPMSGGAGVDTHACADHGSGATGRGSGAGHGTREHPPGAGASSQQSVQLGKQALLKFLASKSCYEMLADSSKVCCGSIAAWQRPFAQAWLCPDCGIRARGIVEVGFLCNGGARYSGPDWWLRMMVRAHYYHGGGFCASRCRHQSGASLGW